MRGNAVVVLCLFHYTIFSIEFLLKAVLEFRSVFCSSAILLPEHRRNAVIILDCSTVYMFLFNQLKPNT